jgi:hypothetical protein
MFQMRKGDTAMRTTWWRLALVAGAVGGVLLYHHLRPSRNGTPGVTGEWPSQKNFGAFPPDLPDGMFDGVHFV